MQTSNVLNRLKVWLIPALFCAAAIGVFAGHSAVVRAKHASKRPIEINIAQDPFATERAGNGPLHDLYAAARRGDVSARLQLAKRYAAGDGVPKNEALAFSYFRAIADQYSQVDPRNPIANQVSEAFRSLAAYYRDGVAAAKVKPDLNYSANLLHYSASYFGDSIAQYELAKMMLDGKGIAKNPRIAIQWLQNARRKGYVPAEALLGRVLWRGEGVQRLPGEGLGLLALAHSTATGEDKPWVDQIYEAALGEASQSDILEANAFITLEHGTSAAINSLLVKLDTPGKGTTPVAASLLPTETAIAAQTAAATAPSSDAAQAVSVSLSNENATVDSQLGLNDLPITQRRFFNIRMSVTRNIELQNDASASPTSYGSR